MKLTSHSQSDCISGRETHTSKDDTKTKQNITKQTNNQTNKQTNKQINKQTTTKNKQTKKTISGRIKPNR